VNVLVVVVRILTTEVGDGGLGAKISEVRIEGCRVDCPVNVDAAGNGLDDELIKGWFIPSESILIVSEDVGGWLVRVEDATETDSWIEI
jgi:hypothetical protein